MGKGFSKRKNKKRRSKRNKFDEDIDNSDDLGMYIEE